MAKITYGKVGDNYDTKDPIKKLVQNAARLTAKNLRKHNFEEIPDSRGESAYVWKQGNVYMASVIEGLGTKNLVADGTRKIKGKTYYDIITYDTVATIINDLVTVGATPLVLHAYWAIEKIFEPQEVFGFIQKHAGLSDQEMYGTFNMGQDYAIFISPKDVEKTLRIVRKNKFRAIDAGYVEKGERQVVIKPKNLIYSYDTLNLR